MFRYSGTDYVTNRALTRANRPSIPTTPSGAHHLSMSPSMVNTSPSNSNCANSNREPNRRTGYRIFGKWRIPDRPEVPKRLRGAIGRIRHNSTEDEIATGHRRTRALRPIPPGTDEFHRLFGLREDSESMHHHLKSHLINRRARTVGLQRQQLNMHAYQAITAIKALIAHSIRTGAPLDEFFGNWRPPDKT